MQDIPDKATLINAVRRFLKEDLATVVSDPGLRFRVLIAANLLGVVAREMTLEHAHHDAEVTRLAELLADLDADALKAVQGDAPRRAALAPLYASLLQGEGQGDEALFKHIKATLAEKLAVINPRFDLSQTID